MEFSLSPLPWEESSEVEEEHLRQVNFWGRLKSASFNYI